MIVYIYDAFGIPMGMKYRTTAYAEDVWDSYIFETNALRDIVSIYNLSGTKLVSYSYDTYGVVTKLSFNGGSSTGAWKNSLTYRGYYYDTESSMYYLQSRYYDPAIGRFINPDTVIAGNVGTLQGYNLYAYCFNNPINMTDASGNWPSFKDIGNFISNMWNAFATSIEAQVGVGFGVGINVSNNITADLSRDTYVGIDDGEITTGNVILTELSLADSDISIGETYDHLVEKGGKRVSSSGNAMDGPFDMVNYPDVTQGNQLSIFIFAINSEGDFLISLSAGVHLGVGGSA